MEASALIRLLILGVLLGGLYALNGMSLSLVFGTMKLINLAHGHLVILGSFFAYYMLVNFNIDPFISLLIGIPLFFVFGYLIQYYMLNRVHKVTAEAPLLITFGISVILSNLLLYLYATYPRALVTSYSLASIDIGITVPLVYVINFFAALVIMLGLRMFMTKTYMGRAIRASSQNWKAAQLMGINTDRIYGFTFGISLTIAAITGVFVGLIYPFDPLHGNTYLILAFFVLVVGGLGNIFGTFLIGILFGVLQTALGHIVGIGYQQFVIYLMLFLILAIRPQGFFGVRRAL